MKKLLSFILFLIVSVTTTYSNEKIEISLLTCSEGKEAFTIWGHSALRIIDHNQNQDLVYNFGLFDFNTPNFYLKFTQGKLKYKLGLHYSQNFFESYKNENREIIEQKLNLSDKEKSAIINELNYLYRPENRYYYYSFVGKNCTSELRDIIIDNTTNDFDRNSLTKKSYRQELNEYLTYRPWLKLGMCLIMGYKVDKKTTQFESLFLPYYLCYALRDIKTELGKPLILEEKVHFKTNQHKKSYPFYFHPLFILSILSLVYILVRSKSLQKSFILIIGMIGLLMLALIFYTEHYELKLNFNILWCSPLYLVVALLSKKNLSKKKTLSFINLIVMLLIIPIWLLKIQQFELFFLPIYLTLFIINIRILRE